MHKDLFKEDPTLKKKIKQWTTWFLEKKKISSKQTKNMGFGQTPNTAIVEFYFNIFYEINSLWKHV